MWRSLALGLLAVASTAAAGEREEVLGEFLDQHWKQLPITPQGPAPEGWSALEASLDPAQCGSCHPQQLQQWQSSLHADAYSPGFAGQLIEGDLAAAEQVRQCQSCHAPLAEQLEDNELRAQGLVCAGCHVRAHRRFGPPSRAELPEPAGALPHGGFTARSEFQESRFCAPCHQFFDDAGVNGKPLENTYREWQASPFADAGRHCQSCHMPDRAHTWQGIHDPEFVRAAVDVVLEAEGLESANLEATLALRSREVGHRFPTYVTPRVVMALWQADALGNELPRTRRESTIGREIDFAAEPSREVFDTRVAPGQAIALEYAVARHADAVELVGSVTVDPDYHYRGVFEALLESLENPKARAHIEAALRRAGENVFVLSETRRALPASAGP